MFESLGQKISSVGNAAKNMTGQIGIRGKIAAVKKDREGVFTKIGEKYYDENKAAVPCGMEELFDEAAAFDAQIAGLEAQYRELAGLVVCPECGTELPKDSKFCTQCGTRLPEIVVPEPEPKEGCCPVCGEKIGPDDVFCPMCGARVKEETLEEDSEE